MYPITSTRHLSRIIEDKEPKQSLQANSYKQPLNNTFEIIEFNDTSTPSQVRRESIENVIDNHTYCDNKLSVFKKNDKSILESFVDENTLVDYGSKENISKKIKIDNDDTICPSRCILDEPKDFLRVCLKCTVGFKASKFNVVDFNKHLNDCTSFTCKYCYLICPDKDKFVYHLKEKHGK